MADDLKIDLSKLDLNKRFPGYFNKWIFRGLIFVMLIYGFYIWSLTGFNTAGYISLTCNDAAPCLNPFYYCANDQTIAQAVDCSFYGRFDCARDLCLSEYIMPGQTIGQDAPIYLKTYPQVFGLGLILAFLINHLARRDKNVYSHNSKD